MIEFEYEFCRLFYHETKLRGTNKIVDFLI